MVAEKIELKLKPYGIEYCGKHDGWAFQFLNDSYEGIHLGVCCKDFLNDIVWSELTKKSMSVHGQDSSYIGVLDKQEYLKICMYAYKFKGITEPKLDKIDELGETLQAFLNEIELLKGFELSTVETHDNKFVIIFHKDWISKIYLFSMFTLLCRIGMYYNGNLEEYLQNPYATKGEYLDNTDMYSLKTYYKQILEIISNERVIEQPDWKDIDVKSSNETTAYDVHDGNSLFNSLVNQNQENLEENEY